MKTIENFIAFFEAIPDSQYANGSLDNLNGAKCANGHLGCTSEVYGIKVSIIADRLSKLLKDKSSFLRGYPEQLARVNNGTDGYEELGDTPKERVLNYLALAANGLHL